MFNENIDINSTSYKVTRSDGTTINFLKRASALDYYELFNCSKIEYFVRQNNSCNCDTVTLLDRAGIDIRLVREEENIVNKTSIAMRKAIEKYDAKATTQVKLKLNLYHDADVLEFLESCESKQGTIKELIRQEIARRKNNN